MSMKQTFIDTITNDTTTIYGIMKNNLLLMNQIKHHKFQNYRYSDNAVIKSIIDDPRPIKLVTEIIIVYFIEKYNLSIDELYTAAFKNYNHKVIRNLMNIDPICCLKFDHDCAMRNAIKHDHLDIVKFLVNNGMNIHYNNDYPLFRAVNEGFLDIVKYLIEKGAKIHTGTCGVLEEAINNRHLHIVKYLVEIERADIHANDDYPLRWSAYIGDLETVKYLVSKGANIHAKNNYALVRATEKNHHDVVKFLIENGAIPENKQTDTDLEMFIKVVELKDAKTAYYIYTNADTDNQTTISEYIITKMSMRQFVFCFKSDLFEANKTDMKSIALQNRNIDKLTYLCNN